MTYATSAAKTLAAIALFASASTFTAADTNRGMGMNAQSRGRMGMAQGHAQGSATPDRFVDKRDRETGVEIKNDGTAVLRGAKVTAISGSTLTVTETLGTTTLSWTVTTTGTTKFEAKNGSSIALASIAVGDTITVKGALVSGSSLTLTATLVRDITKVPTPPPAATNAQQIFEGTLSVLPGTSLPTTLTLSIGSTAQAVNLSTSTTVLNTAWAPVTLALFQTGDRVRVFGYVPTGSTTVTALVVRNVTR